MQTCFVTGKDPCSASGYEPLPCWSPNCIFRSPVFLSAQGKIWLTLANCKYHLYTWYYKYPFPYGEMLSKYKELWTLGKNSADTGRQRNMHPYRVFRFFFSFSENTGIQHWHGVTSPTNSSSPALRMFSPPRPLIWAVFPPSPANAFELTSEHFLCA